MKLSPHFSLTEMCKSQTASRRGIANVPDEAAQASLRRLCETILEPVRAHYRRPILPSSGFRSPALNRAVGGSSNSQHCVGEAVDFEVPGIANVDLAEWIHVMLDFDQLILEYPQAHDPSAGWVHVSFRHTDNRNQLLTRLSDGIIPGFPPFS